jgi:hypothetical protein
MRITELMFESEKFLCLRIEQGKSLIGSNPYISGMINIDTVYTVARQTFGIVRIIAIVLAGFTL